MSASPSYDGSRSFNTAVPLLNHQGKTTVVNAPGHYTLLNSFDLSGTTGFTYSGIPQTFRDLCLIISGSTTAATFLLTWRANGIGTATYNSYAYRFNTTSNNSVTTFGGTSGVLGRISEQSSGTYVVEFPAYSFSDFAKTALSTGGFSGAAAGEFNLTTSGNSATTAISQLEILILGNPFTAGSVANVYGVSPR